MIRASIHGRLGGDPVQREARAGKPMVTVSVAVNVAKAGEEPASEWIGIVAFGAAAEALARHTKGDLISAMGPLTRSSFIDREGREKVSWSLLAESMISVRTTYDRPRNADTSPRWCRRYPNSRPDRDTAPPMTADGIDDLWRDGLVP
jgi:single-strand DNA-binding protein